MLLASFGAIACGLAIATYLCLRASGQMHDFEWLPEAVQNWGDEHGRLRNVPAFAALTLPFMFVCNGRRARRKAVAGLAVFATGLELLQHFIPTRSCEWQDIALSLVGIALVWLGTEALFKSLTALRSIYRRKTGKSRRPQPAPTKA